MSSTHPGAPDQLSTDLAALKIDRTGAPPSSWRGVGCAGVAVLVLAVAGFVGYERLAPSVFRTEVTSTEVLLVSPAQASTELTATGYVVAQRQSKVACQILSRIAEMRVNEGDHVKQGDVLFRVDDAAQRAQKSALRSRALAAKARVQTALAALAELKLQHKRETTLAQNEVGMVATAEDRLEQLHAQEAALEAALQEAAGAEEDVRACDVQLDFTVVKAPFGGVVMGKPLDVGELVGTFTEKPAVELYDPETLRAEIDVPEKRLDKVRPGGPAEIVLEAYPDNRYRAVVEEIGTRVDRSKGTVVAKLKLMENPPRLLPDMRARAGFLNEKLDEKAVKEPPKVVVPRSAVVDRGGAKVVFQIDEGHVRAVPVTLGPEFGDGYELRLGPPPGTILVASPPETMADGQPVKEKAK